MNNPILLASKIEAVAESTFSASSNATSVIIGNHLAYRNYSGKFTFGSTGNLTIKDMRLLMVHSSALQSGDTDIAN